MNLEPPKFRWPDDPFEKFIITMVAAGDLTMLSSVLSQFPDQSPTEFMFNLALVGLIILMNVFAILAALYEPPSVDD